MLQPGPLARRLDHDGLSSDTASQIDTKSMHVVIPSANGSSREMPASLWDPYLSYTFSPRKEPKDINNFS